MAGKMGYYSVEDFMKQKRQRATEAIAPPRANLMAAANHIRSLFEGKKLTYGVMGGLEMLCLGSQREMPDLHIAYDDRDFHRIKAKLEGDQRVRLPDGMNSLFPAKILVRTGPAYKDEGCTQAADIEVDLVPPGSHGTPSSGSLANNLVLLSQKTGGKLRSYKGLNMLYLIKTLVHYCRVRDLAWDPRKDILFLCQHYGEDIQAIRLQLDQKAVQQNFLGTPLFSRLSPVDQRKCYQILLGTDPPPVMAITPPQPPFGHKHSASAQDISNKPRISAHRPSPSLNAQTSTELLSPPLLGKPDPSRRHTSDIQTQISELPASTDTQQRSTSEQGTAARESRSRYRPMSSINTQYVTPVDPHVAIPKTRHTRQFSHQLIAPTKVHQSYRASSYQLQPPGNLAPAPMGAHSSKSMPNLNAGPLPAYAFSQTPVLNPPNPLIYKSSVDISTTSAPLNSGQQHMKSPPALEGNLMPQQRHSNLRVTNQPLPLQARNSHQTQQPARAELSASPMPEARATQLHVVNPDHSTTVEVQSRISSQSSQTSDLPVQAPVELDAECRIGQFIAELSVDRATPAPESHRDAHSTQHQQQRQDHQHSSLQPNPLFHSSTPLQASPVSPPDSSAPPITTEPALRPLNPRTHSAPSTTLPTSLMPGGSSTHHRTQSSTTSASTAIPTTNASRYTRFYASFTPPSSTPGSPQQTYKAYQPSPAAMTLSPPVLSPDGVVEKRDVGSGGGGHKRDVSCDSTGSSSEELAQEYRVVLPGFGEGYGSS